MKDKPLVSIVTPSYNQGKFIEDTLLSVKNQDYSNIEHIVVDGGSTDNTLKILKKYEGTYNLRWISEADKGQSNAVNKGFKIVKGDIVGWINSDDGYFDISTISSVVKYFDKHPGVNVIYGNAAEIDENNLISGIINARKFNYNYLRKTCFLIQPAVFFRRSVIENFKLNEKLEFAMDYDFWLRISKKNKFKYMNRILAVDRNQQNRKTIAGSDDMLKESISLSKEYHRLNWHDKISRVALYGVRLLFMSIEIQRLRYKYNFSFSMSVNGIPSIMYQKFKRDIQNKKQKLYMWR